MQKTVALIYGGEGAEREISILSASGIRRIIDKETYRIIDIMISDSGEWYIVSGEKLTPTFPILLDGRSGFFYEGEIIPADAAIPCLHGDFGEDGIIQGALEAAHIPYVGSKVGASAIAIDKVYTKIIAEHLGIPTAKWIAVGRNAEKAKAESEKALGYPIFIKPRALGSSIGAHAVCSEEEFIPAYSDAAREGGALIEELIDFEYEIECAYFNDGTPRFSAMGSIISHGAFYDFSAKYKNENTPEISVSCTDFPAEREKITKYASALTDFLGLRHISRLDFFLKKDGQIIFNEINTFPGMTAASLYPRLTEDMEIPRGEFINLLLREVIG